MNSVIDLYNTAGQAIKNNPVVAGAFSLWGLTLITYVCKNVPSKFFGFLERHLVLNLSLNNTRIGMNGENYTRFMLWVTPRIIRMRKAMFDTSTWWTIDGSDEDDRKFQTKVASSFLPGYGNHYFFYKGRFCWFNIKNLDSQGVDFQKREVSLSVLFGSLDLFQDILAEFSSRPDEDALNVYQFDDGWEAMAPLSPRTLESVVTSHNLKEDLIKRIDKFLASKEWYERRGIPWKLCILLYGQPGTGKTSLIRALATHYQKNLCFLNMGEVSGKKFEQALGKLSRKSFLVMEELDCASSTAKRSSGEKPKKSKSYDIVGAGGDSAETYTTSVHKEPEEKDEESVSLASLFTGGSTTLSNTLNALDGLMTPSGMIALGTTNHIEKLDSVLLRKGRFDVVVEVTALEHEDVVRYIGIAFPEAQVPRGMIFEPILGCDLQDLMLLNSEDANAFIQSIPKRGLKAVNS